EAFVNNFGDHRLAPQARLALGEIKFAQQKWPEAADAYSAVAKRYGSSYEGMNAELRLGQCEFNMRKFLSAIDHFERVKNRAPKALRSEALLGWALSLMALESHDKAATMLNELLQSYPKYKTNPSAVVPLALIYMERNRFQEALDLLSLIPDDLGARYYRGVTLRRLGQTIAA